MSVITCQNSYGFRPIWSSIFYHRKIYKIWSSTKCSQWKSLKTWGKSLHDVSNDLTEGFFWCQKSYGNTSPLRFFFFQLRPRAHGVIQIKICFSTTKDIAVWFFINNGIFLSQNSYGYKIAFIFILTDKRCQKLVINEVVTDLDISNTGWS